MATILTAGLSSEPGVFCMAQPLAEVLGVAGPAAESSTRLLLLPCLAGAGPKASSMHLLGARMGRLPTLRLRSIPTECFTAPRRVGAAAASVAPAAAWYGNTSRSLYRGAAGYNWTALMLAAYL